MTGADWLSSVFPETDQRRFCVFSPVSSASEAATSLIYGSFRQFGNTTSPTYGTKSGKRRVYALEFRSSYSAYCGKGAIYKPPSKNQLFESAINKPDRHPCGDFSLDLRHPPFTTAISKAQFLRNARMEYASTQNTHGMHLF